MNYTKSFIQFVNENFFRNMGCETVGLNGKIIQPRSQISREDFAHLYDGINGFSSIDRIMRTFLNVKDIEDNDVYSIIYNIIHDHFHFYSKPTIEEIQEFIKNSNDINKIVKPL